MTSLSIPFLKGHGTGNDFVILPDLDGTLSVSARLVAAVCDRRRGIGADGVLVVRRTAAVPEVSAQAGVAPYFMDYRNADGSIAEMCGNGARVFVAYLVAEGLVESGPFAIATRGGVRRVRVDVGSGDVTVAMGRANIDPRTDATVEVLDVDRVELRGAVGVHMPNPHAVCWVDDLAEAGSLAAAPVVAPSGMFPHGVNVEFVHERGPLHVEMRVYERGVGETLSCGTGACAAAIATLWRRGEVAAGQEVRVDVPGGSLAVRWGPDGEVELGGPAVIVARGTIDSRWWESHV